MDQPTVDKILKMIDEVVVPEYFAEYAKNPRDPYVRQEYLLRTISADRIYREIMTMAGRLPKGETA